ncbi:MAG: T9SS type A sorting domain-containing protein [Bacteroidota bacterium]|nr:T9SS type A sorting domain-containing protein [Bacteroidota bacterium]MDP4229069.1 T9SS type A sorting domain-containing protein [Bacteroidota bacterium]
MQRIALAIVLLLTCTALARGQSTFEKMVRFDSSGLIQGDAVIQTSDGGYLTSGGVGFNDKASNIPCLIKFDASGNVQWVRSVSNFLVFEINALARFSDNYFYAVGHYETGSVNGTFIMKFDADGNIFWIRTHAGMPLGTMPLTVYKDGSCIIGGEVAYRPYLMRVDSNGALLWINNFTKASLFNLSMAQVGDSSFVLAGYFAGAVKRNPIVLSIMKIDLSGHLVWLKYISAQVDIQGLSICATQDRGYAVCGRSNFGNIFLAKFNSSDSLMWTEEILALDNSVGESAMAEARNGDLLLVYFSEIQTGEAIFARTDKDGDVKSVKGLSNSQLFFTNSIIRANDGGFVLVGRRGDSLTNDGLILLKVDSLGDGCKMAPALFTSHPLGELQLDSLQDMFGGTIDSMDLAFDTYTDFKETDLCNTSSVEEPHNDLQTSDDKLRLSPNPLRPGEELNVHLNEGLTTGNYELNVIDLLGNTLLRQKIAISGELQDIPLSLPYLPSGVYVLELRNEAGASYHAKFVSE